jgi:hypothetical protein
MIEQGISIFIDIAKNNRNGITIANYAMSMELVRQLPLINDDDEEMQRY